MVNGINMNNEDTELTPQQQAEIDALKAMPDDEIDLTEIPEVTDWSGAVRGLFHMHPDERKKAIQEMRSRSPKPAYAVERQVYVPMDTSERGLETLIYNTMTELPDVSDADAVRERPVSYGANWMPGEQTEYDRDHCVDLIQLFAFLKTTQPEVADAMSPNTNNPTRRQFLDRLNHEVGRRGVIDVLRNGVRHLQHNIHLFYPTPTPGNETAAFLNRQNRFSVTRQLHYSSRNKRLSLDLVLFVNGLPIITMELKNNLTGQTYKHAIEQYKNTRNPTREPLFRPGRCAAHFALDESQVHFCAELAGKRSVFLPFNKGKDGGAGNPVNHDGLRTAYLWEDVLTPDSLTDIIENYAYFVDEVSGGRRSRRNKRAIWPRYHQMDAVRSLIAHARENGVGQKYLIQHSAGSGKSNSIAWLSRLLTGLESDGKSMFDSVVVITDRRILDKQLDDTIKQFVQEPASVEHAESSEHLRGLLRSRKRIITTTVQKFPFVRDVIGESHKSRNYAIVIDEAHSGQGGSAATEMGRVLGDYSFDGELEDYEDAVNAAMESRRLLSNASYFAFTATPKNKTLELFGEARPQPDGAVKHEPFHIYTMKQAIEEGFILDVLANYTPYKSYYELSKSIEDDPQFDSRRAQRKLRRYVEEHPETISQKAAIMVDHFENAVWRPKKLGSEGRAMVVAEGVNRAIEYYHAIKGHIRENSLPYDALVAFSGEREYDGAQVSESGLNGFSEGETAEKFREGDYRILVCADKFQTGYDEPLLTAMYVDKPLSGVKAVQTLSRLNRVAAGKRETYILDFANDSDGIKASFDDYYRATVLSDEMDPNKLHDIEHRLDASGVYSHEQVENVSRAFYLYANEMGSSGRGRNDFDPYLDDCVERYTDMDEDGQVEFKGGAKAFTRTYSFLSQITDIRRKEWEELATFLTFLIPKLPSPQEDDLSTGIEQAVDLTTYAIEKLQSVKIVLEDEDTEIDPAPDGMGGRGAEAMLDPLTAIIEEFNRQYRLPGMDNEVADRIIRAVPSLIEKNKAYMNAKQNADPENVRIELQGAIDEALLNMANCSAEFFAHYHDDADFREWFRRAISRVVS